MFKQAVDKILSLPVVYLTEVLLIDRNASSGDVQCVEDLS